MNACQFLEVCPFFNDKLANMPAIAGYLKMEYCNNKFENCARYQVRQTLGKEFVPTDMYPNEQNRAGDLITEKKRVS